MYHLFVSWAEPGTSSGKYYYYKTKTKLLVHNRWIDLDILRKVVSFVVVNIQADNYTPNFIFLNMYIHEYTSISQEYLYHWTDKHKNKVIPYTDTQACMTEFQDQEG